MNYLILDTNIWIYLANGHYTPEAQHSEQTHSTLLNRLTEKLENEEIRIVVNDIIVQEWDRNKEAKENRIKKYENQILNNEKYFKLIGLDLNEADNKQLEILHEHYRNHLTHKIHVNKKQIDKLDKILKEEAIKAPITPSLKSKVTDWGIAKKAPLHKNKNNLADALIIFSAIEFLIDKIDRGYNHAIFVSNNTEEFCMSKDSNELHSDLVDEFARIGLKLETHLGRALELSDHITELIQEDLQEIEDESVLCQSPFCQGSGYEMYASVYLAKDTLIKRFNKDFDPNQLSLAFEREYLPQPLTEYTESGQCILCGTHHIVCPDCGELIPINDQEEIICRGCEKVLELDLYNKILKVRSEEIEDPSDTWRQPDKRLVR
jgi:predicted nucleic acid-binding protein